jgi:hypothetical protein
MFLRIINFLSKLSFNIALIILPVGILLFCVASYNYHIKSQDHQSFVVQGIETEILILSVNPKVKKVNAWFYTIKFSYKDVNNETVEQEISIRSSTPKPSANDLKAGNKLKVVYDLAQPQKLFFKPTKNEIAQELSEDFEAIKIFFLFSGLLIGLSSVRLLWEFLQYPTKGIFQKNNKCKQ